MRKLLSGLLITAFSAAVSMGACAQEESKEPGSGPNPFTDCGIGAALFPNTGWAAATSNVIWDLGVTGITSATASPQNCQAKSVAAAKFINETYPSIVEQTAQGSGEHLSAVLEIFGCNSAQHDTIIQSIRPSVAQMVASPSYSQQDSVSKAAGYYNVVHNAIAAEFNGSCDMS